MCFIKTQTAMQCLQHVTKTDSIHRIGQDSCWQQFGTTHILVNAFTGSKGPVVHLHSLIHSIGKRPSVNIDMVIYSHMLGCLDSARV